MEGLYVRRAAPPFVAESIFVCEDDLSRLASHWVRGAVRHCRSPRVRVTTLRVDDMGRDATRDRGQHDKGQQRVAHPV